MQICKRFTRSGEATEPVTANCFNTPIGSGELGPDGLDEPAHSRSSSATSVGYRNSMKSSSFVSPVTPGQPQPRKQYQTKARLIQQQQQQFTTPISKKAKTKHDQIFYPVTAATPATSLISAQQHTAANSFNNKFKNIKTISISTSSPSQANSISSINPVTGKFINQMGKIKNQQFIASHLSNLSGGVGNNNNNGPTVKINSTLSNRLRVEEIKMQQQQHMKKQEMLRELAAEGEQQQQPQQEMEVGQVGKESGEETEQGESSGKEKSDSVEGTANLFVSTKSGSCGPDTNGNSNNLIAIKTESGVTAPVAVKLTNGNIGSSKTLFWLFFNL